MKVVCITQARMGSTRLPGKILKVVGEKTLLEYHLERLSRVEGVDVVIVATTTNFEDDQVVDLCEKRGFHSYRGSKNDVLSRYYEAVKKYGGDVVIRVTSDCPLIDPDIVEKVLSTYLEDADRYDYVSNNLERKYPRGMDAEVFSFKALEMSHRDAEKTEEREHVTPYIYQNPDIFRLGSVVNSVDESRYRLTVDMPEDFELIKRIIESLYADNPEFKLNDILELLRKFPEWEEINKDVVQKSLK